MSITIKLDKKNNLYIQHFTSASVFQLINKIKRTKMNQMGVNED